MTVETQNILVFDLGGGTFDVTVMSINEDAREVKSTVGDSHLGGSDIDNLLVKHCIDLIKNQ